MVRLAPPRPLLLLALGALTLLGVAGSARGARPGPTLPAELPASDLARLRQITDAASVAARADGEPFVTRRDVFEYLLDHPEFATHVTRALRLARYRVWREPDGLWLDDGWGARGHFSVVYAANGTRVMYARGRYSRWYLPTIHGQAVVVIEYATRPAPEQRTLITPTITGFVKLDSRVLEWAGRLASAAAQTKAEREARQLARVFARASLAIEHDPAGVQGLLRHRPGVPSRELAEFGALLEAR